MFMFSGCEEKVIASIYLDGKYIEIETLFEIDSKPISLLEYNYYFQTEVYNWRLSDSDPYWYNNKENLDIVKERALDDIRYEYAKNKLAESLGLGLTKKDISNVNKAFKEEQKKYSSYKEFQKKLYDGDMDEALYRVLMQRSLITEKIYEYYFGDNGISKISNQDVIDNIKENYIRYKQIYIKLDYDGTETNKKLAEDLLEQLKNGADFNTLMRQYSRDVLSFTNENGYYEKKSSDLELIKILSAIPEGELADVVHKTDRGYFIFLRLEMNDEINKDITTLRSNMEIEMLDNLVNEFFENQDVKIISQYYDDITVGNVGF